MVNLLFVYPLYTSNYICFRRSDNDLFKRAKLYVTANAKTWVWHNLLLQLMEALKSLKMYFIGRTTAMAGLEIIAACITVVNPLLLFVVDLDRLYGYSFFFPYSTLWKGVTVCSPHLCSRDLCSPTFRAECMHKLLKFLCTGELPSSLINLFNHMYQYGLEYLF